MNVRYEDTIAMRIVAMLPTYNEAANIETLVSALLGLGDGFEVLVIDDHSPDGTWRIVEQMHRNNPRVHLIHRTNEKGRGSAGLAGFRRARDTGFDIAVEMDADFSHDPEEIPALIAPLISGEADIVVGSRLVAGGGETGRHAMRRTITLGANWYIRTLLRLPLRDCTSGFRAFSRRTLEVLPWEEMKAEGPEIVQEVLIQARRARLVMAERPILFRERRAGESTFNAKILLNSLFYVLKNAGKR